MISGINWPPDRFLSSAHVFNNAKYLLRHVAQLSQRDRAAGLVMAKSGRLELRDNIYGQYRSIFNHCDVFGQQRNRNRRKKTQNKGCYAV